MSILDKMNINNNIPASDSTPVQAYSLTKQEIEWLLNLIKGSTFQGHEVEQVYAAAYKLQQQWLQQNKQ